MLDTKEDGAKNGLVNTASRWPAGVVPYYIKEEDFGNSFCRLRYRLLLITDSIESLNGAEYMYMNAFVLCSQTKKTSS